MKVTCRELLGYARKEIYAVGAFNAVNMEAVQAITEAASEEGSPVILQFTPGAIEYAGLDHISKIVEAALLKHKYPIAIHLDHGTTFELCKACIDSGFSSVMIDGSSLPYERNVGIVRTVCEYAHLRKVSVEAELGVLAGTEDHIHADKGLFTDPEQAEDFVKKTGCDSLAVAIGTSHGAYKFKQEAKLRIDILRQIVKRVSVPLVLHGASAVPGNFVKLCNRYGGKLQDAKGVPDHEIREAIVNGITKINTDTDLRLAMTATLREQFAEHPDNIDLRKYLGPARDAMREVVRARMRLFGSSGKG